jgi:A1 cistron-splicing factor AAR2
MSTPDRSGSILIVLDVPQGVEFGIDCITYETGHKFKGLSMVPQGLHFLYHGSGMGDRQGFFVIVEANSIVVKSWDSSQEEILPRHNLSDESLASLHKSLRQGDLNANLGPYPYQQYHTWQNITNFITVAVLNRSDCSIECVLYPGDDSDLLIIDSSAAARQRPADVSGAVKAYFPGAARVARFVDLQRMELELIERIPPGATKAAAVTANMLDKSNLVEHLVTVTFGGSWTDLLGELQLSFVLFMLLYSHPALEHWKRLIYALCSSERYLQATPDFTTAFLRVLFSQLNFVPTDFFENELSTQNFLRPCMTALFAPLTGPHMNSTLLEHKKRLRTFIQKKFNLYETEVFTSVSQNGHQVSYDEEDLYNISEEDLPTFVSAEEISQLQQHRGRSDVGAAEYQAAALSMEAVGGMHIGGSTALGGASRSVFNVQDYRHPAAAAEVGTNEASTFQSRWAEIDSALGTTTTRRSLDAGNTGDHGGRMAVDEADGAQEDRLGRLADSTLQQAHAHTTAQTTRPGDSAGWTESKSAEPAVEAGGAQTQAAGEAAPMTPAEREAALYGWRYPLLYESMALTAGREDMLMSAMRILEEGGHAQPGEVHDHSIAAQRFREAERFVEYEIGGRS